MKTILLTFETDGQRSMFLEVVRTAAVSMAATESTDTQLKGKFLLDTLEGLKFDPPIKSDNERQVALFVAGKKMAEGNLAELNRRFTQEITQHSGSVQIREMRDGEWTVIRQRPMR